MRSFFATLRQLVLPAGAGPGTTRIVLGPDLPPPLNTYQFLGTTRAAGGIIFYAGTPSDASYTFLVFVNFGTLFSVYIGHVLVGVVLETSPGIPVGQSWSLYGSGDNDIGIRLGGPASNVQDWSINGVSQPRGIVAKDSADTDSGAIGAAETTVLTVTFLARSGRAYRLQYTGRMQVSGAGDFTYNVRIGPGAGGFRLSSVVDSRTAAGTQPISHYNYFKHTGADASVTLNFNLFAPAGTVTMLGSTNEFRSFEIWDCGSSADFAAYNNV